MLATLPTLALLGADPGLSTAEFERLHAALQPEADAPWWTIPWRVSLLDARQEASTNRLLATSITKIGYRNGHVVLPRWR